MMVERPPSTENVSLLIKNLDQAKIVLEEINNKPQINSKQIDDLIRVLQNLKKNWHPSFWDDKKLATEGMDDKIETALAAIQLFQGRRHSEKEAGQRNVNQAITSLVSALNAALNTLDKERNLRDLKKYKIGQRVEKTGETKHS